MFFFSLITSEIFQPTNRYRYQFVRKVMTDILTTKETIHYAILGTPTRMKKKAVSISIAFFVGILIRNENIIYEEYKTENYSK